MVDNTDDDKMQAECIVRALDSYLKTFPWPEATIGSQMTTHGWNTITYGLHSYGLTDTAQANARSYLVNTLATSLSMSEKRKSPLQREPT